MAAGTAVAAYFGASGMTAAVVAGAVNGAIVGAAVGAVGAAVNGNNILEGMGKGALTGAATGAVAGGVSFAFNSASSGAGAIPEGTNVSQVGTGAEAGKQVITAVPEGALPAAEGGIVQAAPTGVPTIEPSQVVMKPPTTAAQVPTGVTGAPSTTAPVQYEQFLKEMSKEAFYREAASGAVQAGLGAYASKEEAKALAEAKQAEIEQSRRAGGVLTRDYAAPIISPEYAATRPRVTAPVAERPSAVQVGVARPTADIRNITVQKGVLPNA